MFALAGWNPAPLWQAEAPPYGDSSETGAVHRPASHDRATAQQEVDKRYYARPSLVWSSPPRRGGYRGCLVLCQYSIMGFDVKVYGGKKVADRSAIIAFGSRSEPRRSGEATPLPKVDKALGIAFSSPGTPDTTPPTAILATFSTYWSVVPTTCAFSG